MGVEQGRSSVRPRRTEDCVREQADQLTEMVRKMVFVLELQG